MGSRILAGRYELSDKIGEGGMAVVFKAKDRLLNRHVAIKILKPEFTKDPVFIESFRRESQTAAGLVHPNIVNVYDVGKEGNIYYIVMEYIDGKPLSELIRESGPLEPRRAATIAKQAASALAEAHKHQLIHRDIKPHNILLTSDGVAKISDFGIAKALSTGTLAGSGKETVMGSVHYFSPEQARGGYVDEKSDIYSLGIVLYEMLTGKVPFDGDTAVAVAVKHMNEEIVPPSVHNPDIPADLEDIVMRATSKLQINRYRSAEEMITALNFIKYSKPVAPLASAGGRNGASDPSVAAQEGEGGAENADGAAGKKSKKAK
ncbi:MAG: protein kinase, partial [Anaerovoracaceae bacterium]